MKAELLYDARAALGEGPVWDERKQRLYWVDITGRAIHYAEPASGKRETLAMPSYAGAVALTESGRRLLCVLQDGFYFVHPDTKEVDRLGDPVLHSGEMRFNDAKCDPAGRLLAGTLSLIEGKLSLSKGEGELPCTGWTRMARSSPCWKASRCRTGWAGVRTAERCIISIPRRCGSTRSTMMWLGASSATAVPSSASPMEKGFPTG